MKKMKKADKEKWEKAEKLIWDAMHDDEITYGQLARQLKALDLNFAVKNSIECEIGRYDGSRMDGGDWHPLDAYNDPIAVIAEMVLYGNYRHDYDLDELSCADELDCLIMYTEESTSGDMYHFVEFSKEIGDYMIGWPATLESLYDNLTRYPDWYDTQKYENEEKEKTENIEKKKMEEEADFKYRWSRMSEDEKDAFREKYAEVQYPPFSHIIFPDR